MRRGLMVLLACLILPCLSGCLWLTAAAVVAVVATDDSSSGGSGPDPVVIPEAVLEGAFVPLEGHPIDVVVADIVPDGHVDVAVLSVTTLAVTVLQGDGTGSFPERWIVPLSAEAGIPLSLATVSRGTSVDLLVATSDTLECIRWNEDTRSLQAVVPVHIGQSCTSRELAVGNFAGTDMPDVAVSCQRENQVQVFLDFEVQDGARSAPPAQVTASSPVAIAAADFDLDGLSDLAILEQEPGRPVIRLHLSEGNGQFTIASELSLPDFLVDAGALLEAHDDVFFGEDPGDPPFPDLLTIRRGHVVKILVDNIGGVPKLRRHTGPTGPSPLVPVDAALIRLPRSKTKEQDILNLWDLAAVDVRRNALVFGYADAGPGDARGIGVAADPGTLIYPLPGAVQALGVGDLNEDGQEDIVAVSIIPAVLSVLIARPPVEGVEEEPFFYPHGGFIGEDQPIQAEIGMLGIGRTDQGRRFLATTTPENREILIVRLPEDESVPLDEKFFPPPAEISRFEISMTALALNVADVDGKDGDDIIVTGSDGELRVFLARRRQLEQENPPSFGDPIDLELAQALPPDLAGRPVRTRYSCSALLDSGHLRDLIVPVTVLPPKLDPREPDRQLPLAEHRVAVITNPSAGNPEIKFFKTLPGPRQAVVANLNGDVALDLVIASEQANKVHVLFGDPRAPGSFIDDTNDPALPPVELPGLTEESNAEIEFVWTDNQAVGFDEVAKVILAAGTGKVGVYFVRQGTGDEPLKFEDPCAVYSGFDPETLVLADILGDEGLDLLIADEDLGQIVLLEKMAFPGPSCSPWVERKRLPIFGSPNDFVLLHQAGNLVVASTTTTSPRLETYAIPIMCRELNAQCSFSQGQVELVEAPRRGGPAGLAAARQEDGLLVASIVEDAGHEKGAVDLVSFRSDLLPGDLRSFFSPAADSSTTRLEWEGPEMDAVILGHFSGDDALVDLIGHTVSGGFLLFPRIDRAAPTVPQPTVISFSGHPLGDLLDLERVEMSSGPDLFLAATGTEVCLLDAGGGCTVIRSSAGTIASVACGWSGVPRDRSHLNVAVLDGGKLFVGSFESLKEKNTPLATADVSAIVGCRDLNDDGADDVVLVDGSSVRVFLARKGGVFKEVGVPPAAPLAAFRFANQIEPLDLAFLDANGDSRTDVCIGTSRGDVHILLGDGRGAFPVDRASVVFAGPDLEGIWTADLDGDGRDDVLASVGVPGLVILRSRVRGESSSALGGE